MKKSLQLQHEILLLRLQAQRLVFMQAMPKDTPLVDSIKPRSAVMRFILRRPQLCLWAVGEGLPFLLSHLSLRRKKRRDREQ